MDKDTLKGAGAADSGKEVEFEVELQDNYVLVRDRAKRTTSIPARYRDEGNVSLSRPSGSKVDDMVAYAFAIAKEEDTHKLITFQEAINSSDKDEWVCAMEEEMSSLMKNHTWELVDQPPSQKLGFTQRARIDYNEVFSHVVRHTSIRVIISLTACEDYELEQLDVKMAFLHDDMLIACKSKSEIEYTKGLLQKKFDIKELCPARKILGMKIVRDRGSRTLKVSQSGYVKKILNNYRVDNGKSISVPLGAHFKVSVKDCPSNYWDVERMSKVLYANFVDSLIYLMVCTRPDIAYAVSIVSRDQGKHVDVDSFVDADYAKNPNKVKESISLKGLLIELGVNLKSVVVNCDIQSAIHLSRNAMFHEMTKHINVRYHFIREIYESKEIKEAKIGTKDNVADAFTKMVPAALIAVLLDRRRLKAYVELLLRRKMKKVVAAKKINSNKEMDIAARAADNEVRQGMQGLELLRKTRRTATTSSPCVK
nr:hypothetical protein [Tanacetum cinerariifolium]